MARSRYARTPVVGNHYGGFVDPTRTDTFGSSILDGVQTVEHLVSAGERLDTISFRYYGDEGYWWVIAMANRIGFSLSITGTILKIPVTVDSILSKVQR